jgi:hypothetical protein
LGGGFDVRRSGHRRYQPPEAVDQSAFLIDAEYRLNGQCLPDGIEQVAGLLRLANVPCE